MRVKSWAVLAAMAAVLLAGGVILVVRPVRAAGGGSCGLAVTGFLPLDPDPSLLECKDRTFTAAVEALLKEGATQVYAACTHAVLSGPAIERIARSQIKEVVATDSIPLSEAGQALKKIRVLSVADLLARGIRSIHEESSISELFI